MDSGRTQFEPVPEAGPGAARSRSGAGLPVCDVAAAARRLEGVLGRTPLTPFDPRDPRVELRLKLECLQATGSFKARGAWNNLAQLAPAELEAGVVAASSGNHGRALAWAAGRAGVRATIVMPAEAYPNKIDACRALGAEVILAPTRPEAETLCAERVAAGATWIHPYDLDGTIEGAGTVALEVLDQWPEVEVIVAPVGGGGLLAGACLAVHQRGHPAQVVGVEPEGAPSMTLALRAGHPVPLGAITTDVQGLCPPAAGLRNTAVVSRYAHRVFTLDDGAIHAAQRRLVLEGAWVVEPAGAAAPALVLSGGLPADWFERRGSERPLRIAAIVSGGNPDPAQLAALRGASAGVAE